MEAVQTGVRGVSARSCRSLGGLSLAVNRLDETSAQPVSSADGTDTDDGDENKGDGDQNPLDPGESLSGHVLVAVDEVGAGAVDSSTVSGGERGGTGGPEDPTGGQRVRRDIKGGGCAGMCDTPHGVCVLRSQRGNPASYSPSGKARRKGRIRPDQNLRDKEPDTVRRNRGQEAHRLGQEEREVERGENDGPP